MCNQFNKTILYKGFFINVSGGFVSIYADDRYDSVYPPTPRKMDIRNNVLSLWDELWLTRTSGDEYFSIENAKHCIDKGTMQAKVRNTTITI